MATKMTKNIGTISLTANEIERVTLPASYGFVWVKNMSDGDIYFSLNDEFTAGEDGVIDIPKGECARLQGDTSTVYLLGSGSAIVVAQNFSSCPFKLAAKGGEGGGSSPEWNVDSALSLFSENPVQNKVITSEINKKANVVDIPSSLPANGGNADTVNGHSVDTDVPANAVFTDTVPDLSPYAKTTDVPNIKVNSAGNADTVCGRSVKDLAYINDIICGLRNGWASNSIGTVLTYGDRYVIKTTADLSYIGWTIDSGGWFVPIIVSQYASGTNYTMYGQNCGYDFAGGNDRATFDYKNRTYYACWSSPASYTSPSVIGGLQLTVTNNDYVTACKTLIDYCERIEAFYAKNASIAHEVKSPNSKVRLYEDGEGGNFELTAPDGSHFMQMDLYNNTDFRMYFGDKTTGEMTFPFFYRFNTGKIEINGTSDIYTVLNKPYVTGEGNCGNVVTATAMDLQIFDFTPSAVICQIANGSAFFAETIQNGFRVSLVPTDNGKILKYIAFK